MTRVVAGLEELKALVGAHLGYSEWIELTDATALAYLVPAVLGPLWNNLLEIGGVELAVNAGLNKVSFPAPVPAGARIRAGATLTLVKPIPGGAMAVVDLVVECQGSAEPACEAQAVYLYYVDGWPSFTSA